tara:strand:- start:45 stop:194 length:150 start_codon:yes stop_codon:yes gene_type:complete
MRRQITGIRIEFSNHEGGFGVGSDSKEGIYHRSLDAAQKIIALGVSYKF